MERETLRQKSERKGARPALHLLTTLICRVQKVQDCFTVQRFLHEQRCPLAFIWVAETSTLRPSKLLSNSLSSASHSFFVTDADKMQLEFNLKGLKIEVSATHMKARGDHCSRASKANSL